MTEASGSILIVGGAGYIGSQTAKLVAAAGHRPVVFDNLVYGHRWAVKWGPARRGRSRRHQAPSGGRSRSTRSRAVIHFAAYAYVGESVTDPRKYFRNNVAGTLNLLDAMVAAGVRDVVFSSTCATYGEPERVPIDEDHPQQPGQPVRRVEADGRADAATGTAGRTASATRRCATSTPPAPIPTASSARSTIPRRTSSRWRSRRRRARRAALASSAPTTRPPTAPPSATTSTSPIWPQAHLLALAALANGDARAAPQPRHRPRHSVREVIRAVERASGRTVPVREVGRRAGDPPVLVADAAAGRRGSRLAAPLRPISTRSWHARGSLAQPRRLRPRARATGPADPRKSGPASRKSRTNNRAKPY